MVNLGARIKRSIAIVLVCFLIVGLFPTNIFADNVKGFTDIHGHWAEKSIDKVVQEGLFKGSTVSEFDPQGSMTRGMFITVLHRLAEKLEGPEVKVQHQTFTDVPVSAWYADAISWAVSAGLTNGYGNDKFGPNDILNREQITVLMIRFLTTYLKVDLTDYKTSQVFADDDQISSWAKKDVYTAVALGLIQGEKGNTFNPKGIASRAVVAVIAERFLETAATLIEEETTKVPEIIEEPKTSETPDPGSHTSPVGNNKINITAATIQRGSTEVSNAVIRSNDILSVAVKPANASVTINWMVNGVVKSTEKTYTVQSFDVGSVITVEVTGTGNYTRTVSSLPTGKVIAAVDIKNQDQNKAPVVVAENSKFKNEEGHEVTISETDILSFSITASETEVPETEKEKATEALEELFAGKELDTESLSIHYFAIEANLLVESENNTTTVIHPVGKTTVTLSKGNLGFASNEDISQHVFLIGHTNKDEVRENVIGNVIVIDGEQYVQIELNGLSTIYIGNIPPLTISFNTDGGTSIAPVKVKLGEITPEVKPPTKEGHFFLGWNFDLNVSPIFMNRTVDALWIEGLYIPADRLAIIDPENNIVENQYAASTGTLTLALSESIEYPANLVYTVNIDAPQKAAFYVLSDIAEVAATAKFDEAKLVEGPVEITLDITDANGKIVTGKYPQFIKWFDANQNALQLESVTLVIETDVRSATREKLFQVNRGIGIVEAYLLPSSEEDENYVAYLNGYLNGDGIYNNYSLSLNATFEKYKYLQSDYITIDYSNYNRFKLVFTPFEGESYTGKTPKAMASYWNGMKYVTLELTSIVNEAGLIEITLPVGKTLQDLNVNSTNLYLDVNVKLDNVNQNVQINVYEFFTNTSNNETKNISTDNWAEVVAALNEVSEDRLYIYYNGKSVELDSVITVQETQHLTIQNDLIITSGGELRLVGGVLGKAGNVSVNGDLVIGSKGKFTAVKKGDLSGTYYIPGLFVTGLTTVEESGTLSVVSESMLSMRSVEGIYFNEGSTLDVSGHLLVNSDLELNTNVRIAGADQSYVSRIGRMDVNADLTINGLLEISKYGFVYVSGMTTMNETAEIVVTKGNINLSGKTYNYGKAAIEEGTLTLSNVGYAVNNYGTLYLGSKAMINLPGTTLMNNGELTGNGTIILTEYTNAASRYDNGIDYVIVEGDQSLNDYSRYKFVKDPEVTVNAIIYQSKVSGVGAVSNKINVNEVKIPD